MTGKEKCRMLREIRGKIAAENGLTVPEDTCTNEGPCAGTCPKCDWEVRQLEDQLSKRAALGKRIVAAGLCAGITVALTGCSLFEEPDVLSGYVAMPEPTPEMIDLIGEVPYETSDLMGDVPYEEVQP